MNITIKTGDFRQEETDVVVIGMLENPDFYSGHLHLADEALGGRIRELIELGDFKGKMKDTSLLYTRGAMKTARVLLVGLGAYHELTVEKVRQGAGHAAKHVRDIGLKTATFLIPDEVPDAGNMVQAAAEAILLSLYQFNQHKTVQEDDDEKALESITFLAESEPSQPTVERAVHRGQTIAEGTILARDLSNQPANHLTPTQLAEKAEAVAADNGLRCEVFDKATLEEKGFRTLLAVAQGSVEEPRFIILEYTPEGEGQDTVVLVGKGITFDTGGISLKPGKGMHEMKHDMSGAAAVLGAMKAVGQLKPDLHVIGVIAATENMPSGTAIKPGDVVTSYGGKTIEILNTDAEGRLVLADALGWTAQYNPQGVVDLATLTGAVITCLGHIAAGAMGTDLALMDKVKAAAEKTHERVWELPLWDDYDEGIKSKVADVQNIGDGTAGTIAGGAFLKKFVEDYPWVHLDIAGTAWGMKGSTYIPEGASGYGVRLLVQLVEDW
ncbi:leucyl aminopeptidase [Candidatus Poribacteria bacterium]|nr:MAG: leucyl aminopeptidase [Candidatus Poribacteria bacterium]